jgi:hypothetical protein
MASSVQQQHQQHLRTGQHRAAPTAKAAAPAPATSLLCRLGGLVTSGWLALLCCCCWQAAQVQGVSRATMPWPALAASLLGRSGVW